MRRKLKTKKCRVATCRKEFQPATEWQKFCSIRCRSSVANRKRAILIRKAQRMEAEEQKGAA